MAEVKGCGEVEVLCLQDILHHRKICSVVDLLTNKNTVFVKEAVSSLTCNKMAVPAKKYFYIFYKFYMGGIN